MHDFFRGDDDKKPATPASGEGSLEFLDLTKLRTGEEEAREQAQLKPPQSKPPQSKPPQSKPPQSKQDSPPAEVPLPKEPVDREQWEHTVAVPKSPIVDPPARERRDKKRSERDWQRGEELKARPGPKKAIKRSGTGVAAIRGNVWWKIYLVYLVGIILYFGLIAKDRYVSTSRFAVIRGGNATTGGESALSFFTGSSQSQQDAYTAIAYLESIDMLRWIENSTDLNFSGHFAEAGLDIFNRLKPDSSLETEFGFYQDRVTARLDDAEGLVTVEVEGFDPDFAQQLSVAIIDRTETYLNDLNRDIADQSAGFLMEDLQVSEEKLDESRNALLAFQNDNLTVDPQADVQARLELIQSLKKQKVFNQAEQMRLRRESPNSPHIAVLSSQIAAMDSEMAREAESLTGEGPNQLNSLLAGYSKLSQDLEFATQRYLQNLQIVEEIRLQTLSQHRYLSVVQQPFLPEDSIRPERLYWGISFAILGLLGMQIIRLSIRTVADHG